jgi:hypothetical protein
MFFPGTGVAFAWCSVLQSIPILHFCPNPTVRSGINRRFVFPGIDFQKFNIGHVGDDQSPRIRSSSFLM